MTWLSKVGSYSCCVNAKHVGFVVPLRADANWAERFCTDVLAGLESLDYVSFREQQLDPDSRTVSKGLLRPFPVSAQDGTHHDLAVAYIWSSAEEALGRIRNGTGGRYYKTRKQIDTKVAQILTGKVAGLITVTTGTRAGKPVIAWQRDEEAIAAASTFDGLYALASSLPDPEGRELDALEVLRIYKDQWIVEQHHRDIKQTLRVQPVFLHNDDRIEALIAVIAIALLILGQWCATGFDKSWRCRVASLFQMGMDMRQGPVSSVLSDFRLPTGHQGEVAIRWMRNHLDHDQCGAQRLCVEESRQPGS